MRVHNTHTPIVAPGSRAPRAWQRKPNGLWWADGDAWRDLVAAGTAAGLNGRQPGGFDYEVTIGPGFRMLTVETFDEVMDLSRRFAQPMPHAADGFFWQLGDRWSYDPRQDDAIAERGFSRAFLMNWSAVAREWDGIEILLPVGPSRSDRPFVAWLDTDWGLPSGCAWNVEHLTIELLSRPEGPSF